MNNCVTRKAPKFAINFYLMNALVYVDIDKNIHKGKSKVARNEKRKKTTYKSFLVHNNYIKVDETPCMHKLKQKRPK